MECLLYNVQASLHAILKSSLSPSFLKNIFIL